MPPPYLYPLRQGSPDIPEDLAHLRCTSRNKSTEYGPAKCLASSIPYCATIQYNHQGMPQGMPQPMYGAPQPQTSAYGFSTMTPPSYGNMSHMLPAGIFFPTLTHIDHEQQVHHGGFAGPANARRRASTP
ncbi:hypothetical protein AYO22_10615 [Fonsecaea multimorphosa]|nr:hypothetical protein AYO22_10615 [Fonsecaea multimorphosa]